MTQELNRGLSPKQTGVYNELKTLEAAVKSGHLLYFNKEGKMIAGSSCCMARLYHYFCGHTRNGPEETANKIIGWYNQNREIIESREELHVECESTMKKCHARLYRRDLGKESSLKTLLKRLGAHAYAPDPSAPVPCMPNEVHAGVGELSPLQDSMPNQVSGVFSKEVGGEISPSTSSKKRSHFKAILPEGDLSCPSQEPEEQTKIDGASAREIPGADIDKSLGSTGQMDSVEVKVKKDTITKLMKINKKISKDNEYQLSLEEIQKAINGAGRDSQVVVNANEETYKTLLNQQINSIKEEKRIKQELSSYLKEKCTEEGNTLQWHTEYGSFDVSEITKKIGDGTLQSKEAVDKALESLIAEELRKVYSQKPFPIDQENSTGLPPGISIVFKENYIQ